MNEPIVRAQVETGKVKAKQLLDLVRFGGRLFMHGLATYGRPSYSDSYIFEVTSKREKTSRSCEESRMLAVPGYVSNGNTSKREENGSKYMRYVEAYRPLEGFWSFSCGRENLLAILDLLPRDAEVAFFVYLDAGTNELLVRADVKLPWGDEQGLHADKVCLIASWTSRGNRVVREFMIDSSCGAHNSGRFGGGR